MSLKCESVITVPKNKKVTGVILSDKLKSLDWRARNVTFIGKLPDSVIEDVLKKLKTSL